MSRRAKLKLLLLACSTLVGVSSLEVLARLLTHTADDGNSYFRAHKLKPYRLPAAHMGAILEAYQQSTNSSLMYDSALGWTTRPGVSNSNQEGIWSAPKEFKTNQPDEFLRISLFGGSYTHGGEFTSGWGHQLELELAQLGIKCEVLNFGVPGYSMDQSFLRWQKQGRKYNSHIVVFGLDAGYCRDNLNMVRPLEHPGTEIPFLKPRFILDGDRLTLINSPTPSPEAIVGIVQNFPSWPLACHERFYRSADYQDKLLWRSRFAALVDAIINPGGVSAMDNEHFYSPTGEAGRLALAILRQFRDEVEADGSEFWLLNIPGQNHLMRYQQGTVPYAMLFQILQSEMKLVRIEDELIKRSGNLPVTDFYHDNHFKSEFHSIAGKRLAGEIARHMRNNQDRAAD